MSDIPPPPPPGPGGPVVPPPAMGGPVVPPPPPNMGGAVGPPPPPPGFQVPAGPAPTSSGAGKALTFGILSIFLFWLLAIVPILAIVFGAKARKRIKESGGRLTGSGKATTGLVLGIFGLLAFIGVVVLAMANRNEVAATDLEEGQCVELPDFETEEIRSLTKQSCDEVHGGEVYLVERLRGGDFPGETEARQITQRRCAEQFADYIGLPYDQSRFELYYLYPTESTWDDDREIVCIAFDPRGDTNGTLEGIGE